VKRKHPDRDNIEKDLFARSFEIFGPGDSAEQKAGHPAFCER